MRDQTKLIRAGLNRSAHMETAEALYLSSGYTYDSPERARERFLGEDEGYVYSRYANPTVSVFEERLAALEGAEKCTGTASGMAAVFAALMCQLSAGDHVVASRVLFGSCAKILTEIFPRFGIEATLVDGREIANWDAAVRPETKVFFFESPANPTLELVDIRAVCDLARSRDVTVVMDNAFASPVVQKAVPLGVDVVIYSATKHIDGQGRVLGGAVLSTQAFYDEKLCDFIRHTGPTLSAFNAWVLVKGMETLAVRVEAQARNAAMLADFLGAHDGISRIAYPTHSNFPQADIAAKQMVNGGTLLAFEVAGGQDKAFDCLRNLQLIDISNNLGDTKSLATHPVTTTHKNMTPEMRADAGITPGLIRLSVGLEDVRDLLEDLDQALSR